LLWFVSLPCLQFLQLKKGSHILVLLDVKTAGDITQPRSQGFSPPSRGRRVNRKD